MPRAVKPTVRPMGFTSLKPRSLREVKVPREVKLTPERAAAQVHKIVGVLGHPSEEVRREKEREREGEREREREGAGGG